jgi:murein DD-endopeptidase MepM/ murein hydrolase activator NlpD
MQKRAHLIPAALLASSLIIGLMQWTTAAPIPRPPLVASISSGDYLADRGTTSVREDPIPYVLTTPAPPTPVPVPLPAPPAPVTQAGRLQGTGALSWPVRGTITSTYSGWHQAIDIGANCGTPVLAATAGTITYAGWLNNGGGIVINQTGPNGFSFSYDHLSGVNIASGAVAAGQVIGWVGMTGIATGCHLHFGVYLNGVPVNPLAYL